ncbi:sulfatase-like hydrolase/transferase [Ferrimonas pelagia]|uniref:sulfatase-like hydrolase/transferase n=1 Tax=Ferrimonas pelagia TaxID=1177826 RepID=UPI0031E6B6C8
MLKTRLTFLAGALALGPAVTMAQTTPPNVVIIVADDLGFADVGYKGSPIETPALDSLAAEGIELSKFYSTPICSPTRAALMTGRDPMRLGVAYGVILPWDSGGVHTDEHFMPQSFQAAGYQTAMMGKWHLGHSQQAMHPNSRGFDEFYGHLHTEVGFYPPFSNLGGKDFQRNGVSINDEGYATYLAADAASQWIEDRDKDKPFFLYMPFLAPHTPLVPPVEIADKYAHLTDDRPLARSPSDKMRRKGNNSNELPKYAAVVDAMDQAIGRILTTLEQQAVDDNTIVLFFSDNGASRVQGQGGGDNSPLRGGKAEVYEGGIRVVSLMRWPEKIQAGSQLPQAMSVMDVFPTLLSATGVTYQGEKVMDGLDLWPAISQGNAVEREEYLKFGSEIPIKGSYSFTAFDDQWKLVQWVEQDLYEITVVNELFKIDEDPNEYQDLAAEHPERVAEMAAAIKDWRTLHPANGIRGNVVAPPGWHAPKDWADFPRPTDTLQAQPAHSMAPSLPSQYFLDMRYGERGRLLYDCGKASWQDGNCGQQRLQLLLQRRQAQQSAAGAKGE